MSRRALRGGVPGALTVRSFRAAARRSRSIWPATPIMWPHLGVVTRFERSGLGVVWVRLCGSTSSVRPGGRWGVL